jgi:predicted transcriptional regulator
MAKPSADSSLGDRELDVMDVLWKLGSGTVNEVLAALPAELAYTTVLTILRNLEAKGFARHEAEGKAHRYYPLVARDAARRSALSRVVDRLFRGSPELLLTQLVDDHPLSDDELRQLHSLLERRLAERAAPAPKKRGDTRGGSGR